MRAWRVGNAEAEVGDLPVEFGDFLFKFGDFLVKFGELLVELGHMASGHSRTTTRICRKGRITDFFLLCHLGCILRSVPRGVLLHTGILVGPTTDACADCMHDHRAPVVAPAARILIRGHQELRQPRKILQRSVSLAMCAASLVLHRDVQKYGGISRIRIKAFTPTF